MKPRILPLVAVLAFGLVASACTRKVELFCDENTPCTDPARPFCDLTGEYPASEGIGKTCIPDPFGGTPDAGQVDASSPDAMPRQCDDSEMCDGKDNDCDDEIDEDWSTELGQTCSAGVGACKNTGVLECNAAGSGTACSVQPGTPAPQETCGDNIDDNCNGVPDEGCACTPPETQDCGSNVGECSFGTQTCAGDGTWGTDCVGGTDPVTETCNGKDDNCNNVTDEGCYDLTVSTTGLGTVSSAPAGIDCGTDCTEVLMSGTVITLTATPGTDQAFTGWSGGGCTGTGTCVVTISGDTAVAATFEPPKTLTVSMLGNGGGTVTSSPAGITCGGACSSSFPHGTTVTLFAVEDSQSSFIEWQGACAGSSKSCVIDLTSDTSTTAVFNKRGDHGWTKTFANDGGGRSKNERVAVDSAGNIILAGELRGTLDLGGASPLTAQSSETDYYVAKLSPAGQYLWARSFGTTGADRLIDIAITPTDDVVLFATTKCVDSTVLDCTNSFPKLGIVAKLSGSTGATTWSNTYTGPDAWFQSSTNSINGAIAATSSGQIVIAGGLHGTVDFGGGDRVGGTGTGTLPHGFILWVSDTGDHVRSLIFANTFSTSLGVGPTGAVILTGNGSAIDLGGGPLPTTGGPFLAKFSASGVHVWSRRVDDSIPQQYDLRDVTFDLAGDVFITGTISTGKDCYAARYRGSDGTPVWSVAFNGSNALQPTGIAADSQGRIGVTGYSFSTFNADGNTIGVTDTDSAWLISLDATDGSYRWSVTTRGDINTFPVQLRFNGFSAVAVNQQDDLIVTGKFDGDMIFDGVTYPGVGNDVLLMSFGP